MQRQMQREPEAAPTAASPAQQSAVAALNWMGGVVSGTIGAAAMTALARVQNPLMLLGGRDAWLLYALLGAITGFCAAVGRRKAAMAAAGMSLAVLLSPPLLIVVCAFFGEWAGAYPAMQPLVICAALVVGAFTYLLRMKTHRAAFFAAAAYFIIDVLYNMVRGVPGDLIVRAAIISAIHGALVGGALGVIREMVERLFPERRRTS